MSGLASLTIVVYLMLLLKVSVGFTEDAIWTTSITSPGATTSESIGSSSTILEEEDGNQTSTTVSYNSCECGRGTRLVSRIVGGERTEIQKYPWMAGITAFRAVFCGGCLISSNFVLTAAHCFKLFHTVPGQPIPYLGVRLGVTGRYEPGGDYAVENVIIHEKYNRSVSGVHDIALIKLARPVEPSSTIRPICLPSPNDNFTNKYGTVAGWGVVTHEGEMSSTLREVSVRIFGHDECQQFFKKHGRKFKENSLCAGGEEGKDACQGDSGSPLFTEDGDFFKVIGLVSWGFKCALSGIPGMYTNVARHLPWITSHATDACVQ